MVFLDGPAGTQVPRSVMEAISNYYSTSNANTHGAFITTHETDDIITQTRQSMAALLGAESENTISIGQNMTTLNFALARAMSRILKPGDEVLITQLDHEANRGPWLTLTPFGINVREVVLKFNGVLDYDDLTSKINAKTKLVCMGMSSNCIGTVNNFNLVRDLTNKYHAWLLLDAVHYAPLPLTFGLWAAIFYCVPLINFTDLMWGFYTADPGCWINFPPTGCALPDKTRRIQLKPAHSIMPPSPGSAQPSNFWPASARDARYGKNW